MRAGTNAAMAPLISTPSTRNGMACTHTATNTVEPVRSAATFGPPASQPWSSTASTSTPHSTAREVTRNGRAAG